MPKISIRTYFLSLIIILVVFLFFLNINLILASDSNSPDAIGLRVMPNPEHLSPLLWYQTNIKIKGSPQTLAVDGYEAVRDGRTVYVNASNISSDGSHENLYTNIYIISYNQQAENQTTDIFGQLLEHWKFNTNVPDEQKEKVKKDTKRLADIAEIRLALEKYKNSHNGAYPKLAAGSYLPGISISKWPSWQATLGKELGITMPLDPINKLGDCPGSGFNPETCWNETAKKFVGTLEKPLPDDSRVYVYSVMADGNYSICAQTESKYVVPSGLNGVCNTSPSRNMAPRINVNNLTGKPNSAFSGFISLTGPDAGKFTSWDIELIGPNDWVAAGWSDAGLALSNTSNNTIKKISSTRSGRAGIYKFKVTVTDGFPPPVSAEGEIIIACTASCPSANTICSGKTDTRADGCGNSCNVVGVKTSGDCCQATCNSVDQPGCQAGAPGGSEKGSGACCNGQACYKCQSNYTWNPASKACESKTRKQACPDLPAHALQNGDREYIQSWNGTSWTPATITSQYSTTSGVCKFKCAEHYTWDSVKLICSAQTKVFTCPAKPQTNVETAWNTVSSFTQTWNGKDWYPPDDKDGTEYHATPMTTGCRYKCNDGYGLDVGKSECKIGCSASCNSLNQPNCQASAPANTTAGTGSCCNGQLCYKCKTNYTWEADACKANQQTVNCSGLPAGASWNVATTTLQTWSGTAWSPSNVASYSLDPGTCKFKCNTNYTVSADKLSCVPSKKYFTCPAKPQTDLETVWNATSTIEQTWTGTAWSPAESLTEYNEISSNNSCRYKCANGYNWDEASKLCQKTCEAGATPEGDKCVKTFNCEPKPAGTEWNTVSSYKQTEISGLWSPADDNITNYDTVASTESCRYICASGYSYSSGSCQLDCVSECLSGEKRCANIVIPGPGSSGDNAIQTCKRDGNCYVWGNPVLCPSEECVSNACVGACVPSLTCADYPAGECKTGLNNGCTSTLNCSNNCISPQICSDGYCVDPLPSVCPAGQTKESYVGSGLKWAGIANNGTGNICCATEKCFFDAGVCKNKGIIEGNVLCGASQDNTSMPNQAAIQYCTSENYGQIFTDVNGSKYCCTNQEIFETGACVDPGPSACTSCQISPSLPSGPGGVYNILAEPGSLNISIGDCLPLGCRGTFTADSQDNSWLTLSSSSGTAPSIFTIYWAANFGSARRAHVLIVTNGYSFSPEFVQQSPSACEKFTCVKDYYGLCGVNLKDDCGGTVNCPCLDADTAVCATDGGFDYPASGSTGVCTSNRTVDCTDKPSNTEWNVNGTVLQSWAVTDWYPSNLSRYDDSTAPGTCTYKCSAGYSWDGAGCEIISSDCPEGQTNQTFYGDNSWNEIYEATSEGNKSCCPKEGQCSRDNLCYGKGYAYIFGLKQYICGSLAEQAAFYSCNSDQVGRTFYDADSGITPWCCQEENNFVKGVCP